MAIFILGILVEWGSEIQRLRFKKDVKNRGRVYTKGLFGLTRHINYTGYLFWRTGFALAAAGIIPELDEYCEKKYTNQWTKYKEDVPYKLFPFIL
ncbi:erg4 erg24 ergosterol biosynthesis-like protein [Lentinula edodes]|uniref:Erg4 erg24 ergosterol biosynthesis-like protein n=1 Tax=Lentinula edodes TaxID=5353 RepID=A0A1Q3EE05_LENED|nr:erg4 erg24 ergosterol biosynthesis-like protein [Lentinula edodes]